MTWVRFLTAIVIAPPVLVAVFVLAPQLFAIMVGVVILLGAWEWSRLAGLDARRLRGVFVGGVAAALWAVWWIPESIKMAILLLGVAWWGVAFSLVLGYPQTLETWRGPWRKLISGWLVLIPAWTGMVVLKGHPEADVLLALLLFLIWGADVGAYFVGRKFGRTKLAPNVSPGKSWQGVWGGIALGLICAVAIGFYTGLSGSEAWIGLLVTCFVTMAASVLGDLYESVIKRQSGYKDSGNLLPGHGGIMDRIDSLTAAAPLFALCVMAGAF